MQSVAFYQSSRIGPTPSDGHSNVTNAPVPQVIKPTSDAIAEAAARLRAGSLVAFPTETVYGLGGDAGNAAAVRRIFDAKGRPADHPVIVHLADADDLAHWARDGTRRRRSRSRAHSGRARSR